MSTLRSNPDWGSAAQALIDNLAAQQTIDDRVRVLARCCSWLGDQLYPAFLKLLCAVAICADDEARRSVADTLGHAIATARLPSGALSAWGAVPLASQMVGLEGGPEGARQPMGVSRSLGPIEYLCAWYHQSMSGSESLDRDTFVAACRMLIELMSASASASRLYRSKLLTDVDNPIEGAFTRQTREVLRQLTSQWAAGQSALDVANAAADKGESKPYPLHSSAWQFEGGGFGR